LIPVEWLFAIAGAIVGAVGAWLVLRTREATLAVRATAAEAAAAKLEVELSSHRARVLELETSAAGLRARLDELQDAKTRLTETFNAAAAEALKGSSEQFLKLAQAHLSQFQEGAKGDLEKRQLAIDALVKPLRESLEKVDGKIGELEKNRAGAYSQLSEQLKNLGVAQAALHGETAKLSTALSATKTSGTWGEIQLRRVVELAGMVEHCDFTEQEVSGASRPDLVVKLPLGQQIVVDAKAPTDAYREAAAATDPNLRAAKFAEHATRVRAHVDALSARAYWDQFQPSPELVVLFLPGDQFLAAALEADPALMDRAIRSRVLLVTPSTLVALLKAAAYGWRQDALSKNAEEISKLGRDLYDRVVTFADHFERLRRGLGGAVDAYNSAVGSLERSVLPGARKFSELGVSGAKPLPTLNPVDESLREITATELRRE
jgi:DNA recombination protein RmuC